MLLQPQNFRIFKTTLKILEIVIQTDVSKNFSSLGAIWGCGRRTLTSYAIFTRTFFKDFVDHESPRVLMRLSRNQSEGSRLMWNCIKNSENLARH